MEKGYVKDERGGREVMERAAGR